MAIFAGGKNMSGEEFNSNSQEPNEAYEQWKVVEESAQNNKTETKITPNAMEKLKSLSNGEKEQFVNKHLRESSFDSFRVTYDKLNSTEKEIIDHWRFLEDAGAILDNQGEAYKNIVNAYYDSHFKDLGYSPKHPEPSYYTKKVTHKKELSSSEQRLIDWKWLDGYKKDNVPEKLTSVVEHFAKMAEEQFGKETEEYFSIIKELQSAYTGDERKPIEIFYKLKLKEFDDRKCRFFCLEEGGTRPKTIDHISDLTFGALLDVASSDDFDPKEDVVIQYGNITSHMFSGGYDGEHEDRNSQNSSKKPEEQPPKSREARSGEKSPAELGFSDWSRA